MAVPLESRPGPAARSLRRSAARLTIAEVETLVEPGALDPHLVHTPGIYVKRILQGSGYERRIEKRTTRNG